MSDNDCAQCNQPFEGRGAWPVVGLDHRTRHSYPCHLDFVRASLESQLESARTENRLQLEALQTMKRERDEARAQAAKARWCDKHAVMQPCQFCPDERIVAKLAEESNLRSRIHQELIAERTARRAAETQFAAHREAIERLERQVVMLKHDCPRDADCDAAWEAHKAKEELARHRQELEAAQIKSLRYIDGWIDNKFAMNLTRDARGILDDMRVHIRAAIARIESGERMEATTPLGDMDPPAAAPANEGWTCSCNPPWEGRAELGEDFERRWNPRCRLHGDERRHEPAAPANEVLDE